MALTLKGSVSLDGSGWEAGLNRIERTASKAFGGLRGQLAGLFTVGAITAFSRKTIEFAGHMRDLADKTRTNVEWLQKMNNALGQSGSNADSLASFLLEVGKSREAAAANPAGKEAAAFGRLGMSRSDITGLSQQDFVDRLAKAFGGGASLQAENDLMAVGGKAGKEMIAAFRQGISDAGPIISEEVIDQLDELGDSFYMFQQQLMASFAPGLAFLMDRLRWFTNQVAQTGTFLGGLFASFNLKHFLQASALGNGMNYMAKMIANNWDEATKMTVGQDADQRAAADAAAIQAEEARRLRRQRESAAPLFGDPAAANNPLFGSSRASTDALLTVGNFLGAGRASIENVGRQTNRLLTDVNRKLDMIHSTLKSGADTSIGIPGT